MKSIKIISTGKYLPEVKMNNIEFAKKMGVTEEFLVKKTGIMTRYFVEEETMEYMATKAAKNAIEKIQISTKEIDMILVATTTSKKQIPGISYLVQKNLEIKQGICLDILAGCSGYINALDIARNYIAIGKIKTALVVGVDILSQVVDLKDIGSAIVLSDGAGATIIQATEEEKQYESYMVSDGMHSSILTCSSDRKLYMDGKAIYKYAVTETVNNIEILLQKAKQELKDIKWVVPHQSNLRILQSIEGRLHMENKMYINIDQVGNTFCASIPIAIEDMMEQQLLENKDKIILLGYGGGLNTGSILLEI